MKTHSAAILGVCLSLGFSSHIMATEMHQKYQNPFISTSQASAFAASAPAGLMAPTTYQNMVSASQMTHLHSNLHANGMLFNLQHPGQVYQNLITTTGDMGNQARFLFERMGHEGIRASAGSLTQDSLAIAQNLRQSKSAFPAAKGTAGEVVKTQQKGQVVKGARTKANRNASHATKYGKKTLLSGIDIIHQESLYAGAVGATLGAGFELFSQLSSHQEFDWQRFGNITLLNGVSGYAGTFSGAVIQRTMVGNQSKLLSKLVSTKFSASLLGGFSAGTVASAIFSYGTYFLGYSDLKTANRSMIAGTLGAGVFSFGSTMVQTLLANLGTTAISASTMGGSTLGGSAIIGTLSATGVGLVAIAAISVGAGTMYLFQLSDKKAEHKRVDQLIFSIQENLMDSL